MHVYGKKTIYTKNNRCVARNQRENRIEQNGFEKCVIMLQISIIYQFKVDHRICGRPKFGFGKHQQ